MPEFMPVEILAVFIDALQGSSHPEIVVWVAQDRFVWETTRYEINHSGEIND
jgi:hypothetical protein